MQTVSVPTVNDDTNEQLEEFSAQLSNPSVGLMLGSNISAQIDIEDNDRKLLSYCIYKITGKVIVVVVDV